MLLYTIGFTRRTAEDFFGAIRRVRSGLLLDVRLNNTSQLSGFTKRDDLRFFLREICQAQYLHEPMLAPSAEILDDYKKGSLSWTDYETRFRELLSIRGIETRLDRRLLDSIVVILCSEYSPKRCHRRLVAEYLQEKWGGFDIVHL